MGALSPPALFAAIEGLPYSRYTCFDVAAYLYAEAYGLNLETTLAKTESCLTLEEVWYAGDQVSPYEVLEPWDLCWFAMDSAVATHVGVSLGKDASKRHLIATSTQKRGAHRTLLSQWAPHLVQICRVKKKA